MRIESTPTPQWSPLAQGAPTSPLPVPTQTDPAEGLSGRLRVDLIVDEAGSIEGLQEKLRRVFDAVYQGGIQGGLTAKEFSTALKGIAESYFRPDMTDDDKAEVVRAIHAVAKGLNRGLLGERASHDETIHEKTTRLRAYYDRQLMAAVSRGESGFLVAHWDLSNPVLDYSYRRVGHLLDNWGKEALKGTGKELVADPSDERLVGLLVDSSR